MVKREEIQGWKISDPMNVEPVSELLGKPDGYFRYNN